MGDDDFKKLDDLLAEKIRKKEEREQQEAESKARRSKQRAQNLDLLKDVVVPTLEEVVKGLKERGFACKVVVEPEKQVGATIYFNPRGRLASPPGKNASVEFNLRDSRLVSTRYNTRVERGGGISSSGKSLPLDEHLAENVRSYIMEKVIETVDLNS